MKFEIVNRFPTTVANFERVLDDPQLYDKLRLPGIDKIEPLERADEGDRVRRRTRYTPNTDGKIPAFAVKSSVVKPSMLCWVEESTYDKARHRFDYRILPNLPEKWRDRFQSHGSYQLTQDGSEVVRRIDGEIVVRVPLLGRTLEKMLVKEVTENFRAEAEAMSALLRAL